jgi:hypothetical protein
VTFVTFFSERRFFDGTGVVFVANFGGAYFQGVYTIPINPPLVVPTELILKIAGLTPDSVRLSWLDSIRGALLETTTDFLAGPWSKVASTVVQTNGENMAVEKIDFVKRFYPLVQP